MVIRNELSEQQVIMDQIILDNAAFQASVDALVCEEMENNIEINRLRQKLEDCDNHAVRLKDENHAIIILCKQAKLIFQFEKLVQLLGNRDVNDTKQFFRQSCMYNDSSGVASTLYLGA